MSSWIIVSLLMINLHVSVDSQRKDSSSPVQDSSIIKSSQLPARYLSQVKQKSARMEHQVSTHTDKVLSRLMKQEKKMKVRLWKVDSVAAMNIFSRSIDSLGNLRAGLKSKLPGKLPLGSANGYLDTLSNSLNFLEGKGDLLGFPKGKLNDATKSVASLQDKLQQADQIKAYIRQHKKELKEQLSKYTGFSKDLMKINKEAYYYGQQVSEYKAVLKDKKKAEAKAMEVLKKMPEYNDFLRKHSQIASLFNLGNAGSNVPQRLEGLQTRSQVEQLIQQRLGSDPVARQAVGQQMEQARAQLNDLKEKFPDLDNAGEMPDFKPNPMKTKSFLQRLEFGGNIQFQKSNRYFPTTSDIAGQVGYKFHKNGSAGIGASYKLGLGSGWNHIAVSHQGVGLRSFADWKLKGTFFVNGGFEQNHVSTISRAGQLKDWSGWQGSALLGVSKKYKAGPKLKGNIMLLYDFLAQRNTPATSPVKLRLGYIW
ncbi:Predicted nucleic acid-binding protein, contains Zn-ribbon domain [Chitinophaga sp. YR627]|uniref:hypothetical protein n=1 Tax=Chitinophaga sp. YR627 TaxID=1881041 RepID=UPI0008EBCF52|nr:hypothetical protein [Chitinophaga sp. YR627]SFM78604.1 Predicted nucleic acid-binding protein, contains Zn-ribbon domain [Chitinophaga sp. YR627]